MERIVRAMNRAEPMLLHHGVARQAEPDEHQPRSDGAAEEPGPGPGEAEQDEQPRSGGLHRPGLSAARAGEHSPDDGRVEGVAPAVADRRRLDRKLGGGRRGRQDGRHPGPNPQARLQRAGKGFGHEPEQVDGGAPQEERRRVLYEAAGREGGGDRRHGLTVKP